jgi:hypothetical protein
MEVTPLALTPLQKRVKMWALQEARHGKICKVVDGAGGCERTPFRIETNGSEFS